MDSQADNRVSVREEVVTIPTYGVGEPNKTPMFLEKRVYQGSSGAVYPHPIVESISDVKADRDYQAIILENRYLKIMLLPEIGGRVQMALDKTNGYHFVYYNQVIKPALVGLIGPWISGGIEFNWPQHHRPSTFEPVDTFIEAHPDGSKTAWMGEIERMTRTKGMAGFTLYPGRAYLEIRVQLYNRTSEPQTFLWWANPAVHVNDDSQSVFPPDVHAVMDHGKRDVSSFPIATGTYYKVDYSPGTDISRYKNIPVPTSYMAHHSDFDFLGCYDHGVEAGMLHVANHHLVPGKKQWTWGNGDFGRAWDRQLTDEDGPYIELMCGAFTDNQPDFTWIQPGEEKRFTQVFMPYKLIGSPKNATKDAAVSLEVDGERARLGVYLSSQRTVRVILHAGEATLYDQTTALGPETALVETVALDGGRRPQELTLRVVNMESGAELVSYTPLPETKPDIPPPAQAARPPAEIESNEELFLNGLHLEQYRHATYEPEAYYREALRRDPGDSRCNNALGRLLLYRGRFEEAEGFFRKAIERLIARNPNPVDGKPFYHLGWSLAMQGRGGEAFDAFYKATWSAAWGSAAYFELARLASRAGRHEEALALVKESLASNRRNHQAGHLRAALLRRLGQEDEARAAVEEGLAADGMNYGLRYEQHLLDGNEGYRRLFRDNPHTYIEIALDYVHAGLYEEALNLLSEAPGDPMATYYRGWAASQAGDVERALAYFKEAVGLPPDYCFPNRVEAVLALEEALWLNPGDPRAPYYLGNFWYAHRQYDQAIEMWERARIADPDFATPYRNLGLAAMNKQGDPDRALALYERAFALDKSDSRVLFELDQLYKKTGKAPDERLQFLEEHLDLVDQRDDLTVERASLLNRAGRHEATLDILLGRTFHPWEGGEGKVTGQYVLSLVEIAKKRLGEGRFADAVDCLEQARVYPENLGEGKLAVTPENQIDYFLGRAYEGLGDDERSRACFERASIGSLEPVSPLYYNDQPPEMIFYQGLALGRLGRESEARAIFERLVSYGHEHLDDRVTVDYFAVSLPDFLVFDDDLELRNRVHCHFIIALGHLGLGQAGEAAEHFERVLAMAPHHLGAVVHRGMELMRDKLE